MLFSAIRRPSIAGLALTYQSSPTSHWDGLACATPSASSADRMNSNTVLICSARLSSTRAAARRRSSVRSPARCVVRCVRYVNAPNAPPTATPTIEITGVQRSPAVANYYQCLPRRSLSPMTAFTTKAWIEGLLSAPILLSAAAWWRSETASWTGFADAAREGWLGEVEGAPGQPGWGRRQARSGCGRPAVAPTGRELCSITAR